MSAVVRGGRVCSVVVSLDDSVPLGSGRVPERSVEGRVAESLPPVPQPMSPRTRLSRSPVRSHAMVVRRPGMPASPPRSLVGDRIRRDSIKDVRIDDHLRVSQGKWGHARHATAAIVRPAGPAWHHPKWVRTWPPEPASGYTAQAERTATYAHVGSGAIRRAAGGAGLGGPPACVSRPTRACCRVVGDPGWAMGYAVLAMLTRAVQQALVIAQAGIRRPERGRAGGVCLWVRRPVWAS